MYIKLPIYLFSKWGLDLMILMGANPLLGPLEGVGPEYRDIFETQMALASLDVISVPKIILIFRSPPFQWPSSWICPHQNDFVPRHINNRYIKSILG
jgi:hypothetical protein